MSKTKKPAKARKPAPKFSKVDGALADIAARKRKPRCSHNAACRIHTHSECPPKRKPAPGPVRAWMRMPLEFGTQGVYEFPGEPGTCEVLIVPADTLTVRPEAVARVRQNAGDLLPSGKTTYTLAEVRACIFGHLRELGLTGGAR